MKVKFKVCLAGADFVRNPGDVADLPEAEAMRLIDADYASPVKKTPAHRTATEPQADLETAVDPDAKGSK